MTTEQELRAQRAAVQERRTEHERRERTVTDLRTVRHTLERRVRRELRDAPAVRTDEELVGHVDRLLRRHTDGDRPLGYLGEALDEVDAAAYVRDHFEREVRPVVESHVDELTVDAENALREPFPSAVASFLDAARDRQAGQSEADAVRNEYRKLLNSRDTADRLRGLAVVGVLVDLARLAVVGTGDDDVRGVRTALHDAREEHVESLAEADRRLLGEDEPDPYVALEWTDPVAMLPVRLETRFVGDDLLVRIYPEQLHVDTHEAQLTEAERDWGVRFWTRLWTAGVPDTETLLTVGSEVVSPERLRREEGRLVVPEKLTAGDGYAAPTELPARDARETALELLRAFEAEEFSTDPATRYEEVRERAWADGVERFGEERAGYVLESLAPTATDDDEPVSERLRRGFETGDPPLTKPVEPSFPDVDVRPESWTKTPRASLLPDRFVVRARYEADDGREEYTDWTTVEEGDVTVLERREGTEWVRRVAGPVVREPLAVGPSPEAVAAEGGDAATEMEWMTDFDAAEDVGLGIVVPLPTRPDYDRSRGFSTVEVTGAKTTMDDAASAEALSDLLSATEHTEGLELLSRGTPTNNADRPSPRSDGRDPAASLDVETRRSLVGPGTDGGRLADALGVPRSTFAHVAGAGDTRDRDARAMNRALWPATIGYYVRNLLVPGPGAPDENRPPAEMLGTGPSETGEGPPRLLRWLETYRDHFVEHVRGGGPFQTLRAGDQPYGVLPVAPLEVGPDDRAPADVDEGSGDGGPSGSGFYPSEVPRIREEDFVTELIDRVWTLRDEWLQFSESVPSVGDDPGLPEDELLSVLAMEATAHSYRRQLWLLGDDNPVYRLLGLDRERDELSRRVREDLTAAGLPTFGPRMADLLFLGALLNADDLPIVDEDVTAFVDTVRDLFATTDPVRSLRTLEADPDGLVRVPEFGLELERDAFFDLFDLTGEEGDYDPTESLLRQLLRFGALQAAVASRVRLGAIYGWRNEYVEFPAEPTSYGLGDRTVFDLFGDDLPTGSAIDGGHTLADHPDLDSSDDFLDVLRATGGAVGAPTPPPDPELADFVGALAHLAGVDPERLERLTTETTDLASHRLDAWWTSIAARRLEDHRAANSGVQIGAYGFVEALSPGSGPDAEYLLAPSLDQATTSAVLRSAHKARDRPDDPDTSGDERAAASALAVNCSPERVQTALPLMRAVRRGQDLPELLGYRFERGLRAYSEEHGMNLERHLDDFRELAPTVEDKLPRGDTEVGTRQSDVADGMRLYRLWKEGSLETPLLGVLDANSIPSDLESALGGVSLAESRETGVFPAIHRTMEAVSDVLLAEGVHHLVHGRPERAAAALEAHSRGETPPEPTVLDTPRSETGVTHRLLLAWGDAESPTPPHAWRPTHRAVLRPDDVRESSTGRGRGGPFGGGGGGPLGDRFEGIGRLETVQVRHEGEPALDAWVGDLLPNPEIVGCTGEFRWERDRAFAVGEFETPAEARPVTVDDVGFEPDVVQFAAVPASTGDGPVTSDAAGWSHGVFKRAVGEYDEVQRATSASVAADGEHSSETRDAAVAVTFPEGPGDDAAVTGTVTSTTADGFEVSFHTVKTPENGPERVAVQYRALKLADPTSVRVGVVETPEGGPGDTVVADLDGGVDEFSPDHVTATACLPIETSESASNAVGFAHGEATLDRDGDLHQQTTGLSLDPGADEYRVSVRDDAIIDVDAGADGALRLSIDALETLEASVSAPNPAAYPGATTVTVLAAESPRTETPAGERLHRPAAGTVAAPASADQSVVVDTGFRPALIEARLVPGATGSGAEDLPVETSVDAGEAQLSLGAATGTVAQRSLSSGVAGDAASANRGVAAVGTGTMPGGDGPTAGLGVRVDGLDDGGFELSFSNLPEGDSPLLQYRAWPVEPESQGFSTPLEWPDGPDGLSLSDLELTPLDAVALSQGVGRAGDSQLERRFGYHAFRNRPADRPPVPDDATLDLAFAEPSPDHDVSVAEYVEVARRVRDLVGEARPADATDLVHPSEASDEGYLPASGRSAGTAERLAMRVRGEKGEERGSEEEEEKRGIEGKLADVEELLTDRRDLLSADTNVCDEVADLEDAVRAFRRAAPVSQVADVTDDVATEHPTEGPWNGNVSGTVLEELDAVAEHVRVGPTGDVEADVVVESASEQEVSGVADVSGATDVAVTVRSHSDAVRFPPKRDGSVRTDGDGAFSTEFDFSNAPPGTAFTVVAAVESPGRSALPDPGAVLVDVVVAMDPAEEYALLVQLAAAELFDPPGGLAAVDQFERLVEDARDEFDARVETEELVYEEELLRWRQDIQRGVLDEVEREGLPNWFDRLPPERRVRLFEGLPREGTLRALALVGRDDYVRDYLDRRAESGPVYAAAGRVVDADGGESRDLATAIGRATYLPWLLWLDRVAPAFRTDEAGEAGPLRAAVHATPWDVVTDERDVMRTMARVLGHRRDDPAVFSAADQRAVADLLSLRDLDFRALRTALRAVVGPASWTGLTELVTLTGARDRPAEQRHWRASEPDVGALVPKHPEGEVRARLERLREFPDTGAEGEFAAYSPPLRRLVSTGRIDPELLVGLEQFVADPAALVDAFGDVAPDLPDLLADVHDLLHHTEPTDPDAVGELPDRVESFLTAVDDAGRTAELAERLDAHEDLLPLVRNAEPKLVRAVRSHERTSQSDEVDDALDRYASEIEPARETVETQLSDRVIAVTAHDDASASFRAGVLESVRHVLLRASYFGIYGSVPASAAGGTVDDEETLVAQVERVRETVSERLTAADALATDGSPTVDGQVARLQALLGDEFVVLPPFAPTNPDALHATLSDDELVDDRYETDAWLRRIARVRDLPADFQRVRTYADALSIAEGEAGGLRRSLTAGQLPHEPGAEWLGRDDVTPSGGELSLGIAFANEHDPVSDQEDDAPIASDPGSNGSPLAGLLLDEWVERVPEREETIGLGLQYDDPSTRAPQSVLLAVPPTWQQTELASDGTVDVAEHAGPTTWTTPMLRRTVDETRDLVDVRSVDLDAMERFGHLLPMLCFANNDRTMLGNSDALPDAPSVEFDALDWEWWF